MTPPPSTPILRRPNEQLRIWRRPEMPMASDTRSAMAVEWRGRVGHPTSFAMLGGYARPGPGVQVDAPPAVRWNLSLAGKCDEVYFGLPHEYVEFLQERGPGSLFVTTAAHGYQGSSPVAFYRVASLLDRLLKQDGATEPESVWSMWDEIQWPLST